MSGYTISYKSSFDLYAARKLAASRKITLPAMKAVRVRSYEDGGTHEYKVKVLGETIWEGAATDHLSAKAQAIHAEYLIRTPQPV